MRTEVPRTRRSWHRKALFVSLAIGSLVAAAMALVYYKEAAAEAELRAAWEEADRLDPGWRMTSAEEKTEPDDQNSFKAVVAVARQLPKKWMDPKLDSQLAATNPHNRFSDKLIESLRVELQPLSEALHAARKVAIMRPNKERIPPTFTQSLHGFEPIQFSELMKHDAWLLGHEEDIDGVMHDVQAVLVAAQAQFHWPSMMSCLVRMHLCHAYVAMLERGLAQGNAGPKPLAKTQAVFEEEMAQRFLVDAWRGERAGVHGLYRDIREGKLDPQQFMPSSRPKGFAGVVTRAGELFRGPGFLRDEAATVRYYSRVVELAKQPSRDHLRGWGQLRTEARRGADSLTHIIGMTQQIFEEHLVTQAKLRCSVVGLAAERFRMTQSRWPDTQDELVQAKLLIGVALDPYTGEPLRLRRAADGLVVYSVGPKGNYVGDALDNVAPHRGVTRTEFRLWDLEQRRQAPPAKP